MSAIRRSLVVAALLLCGASVASAQNPGLRPAGNGIGVRPVTTVSPVPAMQLQQQQAWQNAFLQAQLWQMYNPPVVVVNPNPWVNPYVNINPFFNPNATGALWQSNTTFYRNTAPAWGTPFAPWR